MFEGVGLWSGKGATAASKKLTERIYDLETAKDQLKASATLFHNSSDAVISAKNQIIDNVAVANKVIEDILKLSGDEASDAAKEAAIQAVVDKARAANIAVVANEGFKVSGKVPELPDIPDETDGQSQFFGPNGSPQPQFVPASNLTGVGGNELVQELPNPQEAPLSSPAPSPKGIADVGGDEVEGDPPPETPAHYSDPPPSKTGLADVGGDDVVADPPPPPPAAPAPPAAGVPEPGVPDGTTGLPGPSGIPGAPAAPAPGRIGTPASPLSGTSTPTATPATPAAAAANPSPALAQQAQLAEFNQSMADAATQAAAQTPIQPPTQPTAPLGSAPAAQPYTPPPVPDTAPPPTSAPPNASGPSGGVGAAPVTPGPGVGAPTGAPIQLGPPPTPSPAAPIPPAAPLGPSVTPAAAGPSTLGAPAPVPVSAARAEREAMAAAATAGALRRRSAGNDSPQLAQRIAAALNVGIADVGFYWVTGLAKDGSIVVANNYGLGYIPDGVNLPEQVKLVTADESIPANVRGTWATYPILGLHGWAQHHGTDLRAVIATEDQFKGFDPGTAKIVLRPDDIPETGQMEGRHRLQVIAPDTAMKLAAVSGSGLAELLPPPPADATAPEDNRATLWFEVFRPLLSNAPDRGPVQLQAFVTYAEHASEIALYQAHTATTAVDQRVAIADWIYWQHLSVLMSDAITTGATV